MNHIPLIKTFSSTFPLLALIIKNWWDILRLTRNVKDIFQKPGLLTYRLPNNLGEQDAQQVALAF